MENEILEIRWHGRGGQGAKTAALLFADAALSSGKHMQAFPEYGPERMGAPVAAFNRISDNPITLHCGITSPKIVIVLDASLMGKVNVADGLPNDGILIVNTTLAPSEIRKNISLKGAKVYTVDASGISKKEMGREIPNTPMLGALLKASGLLDFNLTLKETEVKLNKKFAAKPEIVAGNIKAIKRAYEEVRSE
ncbi:MAG: porC [Candidatus Saganbacteria bacterium]|uniref:PorC n=1 Tax=Candidatus Saganbacteria bacterium TaxID=2575572 RepID=A0A833L1V3_UNCSA|nr:MAG: porC [Candidatus Saganbacteria bacterium]